MICGSGRSLARPRAQVVEDCPGNIHRMDSKCTIGVPADLLQFTRLGRLNCVWVPFCWGRRLLHLIKRGRSLMRAAPFLLRRLATYQSLAGAALSRSNRWVGSPMCLFVTRVIKPTRMAETREPSRMPVRAPHRTKPRTAASTNGAHSGLDSASCRTLLHTNCLNCLRQPGMSMCSINGMIPMRMLRVSRPW